MKSLTCFSLILLIVISSVVQVISLGHLLEKFVCYEIEDQVKIECNPKTKFAFEEVIYGFPDKECPEWTENGTCSIRETNCLIKDKFWSFMKNNKTRECSGRNKCQFQTTHDTNSKPTEKCENATLNSCFLNLKGRCIYEENNIDFCTPRKISGGQIFLHNPDFPKFDRTGTGYECECHVTSQDTLRLDAVLFSLDFLRGDKTCNSSLQILNNQLNLTFGCDAPMLKNEAINISSSKEISLKMVKSKPWNPYQIWMKIHSTNQEEVSVDCRKRIYHGIPPSVIKTTTRRPFKVIILEADRKKMDDFLIGVKVASGVLGALFILSLIIIAVVTYKRSINMIKTLNKNKN